MSETAAENQVSQTPQPVNKVKRTTNALLALTMVSIGTAIVADRIIPTTDNVRVEGNVVSLIPQVSGQVDSVSIKPNTQVKKAMCYCKSIPNRSPDCGQASRSKAQNRRTECWLANGRSDVGTSSIDHRARRTRKC